MRRSRKPAKAKVEARLPVARKSAKNEDSLVRDLEKRLEEFLAPFSTEDVHEAKLDGSIAGRRLEIKHERGVTRPDLYLDDVDGQVLLSAADQPGDPVPNTRRALAWIHGLGSLASRREQASRSTHPPHAATGR